MVCSSCSTSGTRHVKLVINLVKNHEWWKDREVFTRWSCLYSLTDWYDVHIYDNICEIYFNFLFFLMVLRYPSFKIYSYWDEEQQSYSIIYICYLIYMYQLWIGSLNSDGQLFHQYQQNKQSPLTLTH
jgi:hypothetical protein